MKFILLIFSTFWMFSSLCFAGNLELVIEANHADLQKVLETALVLPAALENGELRNKRWLRHYQKQLPSLISSTLEPYGFFHSQTQSRLDQSGRDNYLLKLQVSVGEPVIISNLLLELAGPGAALPALEQALKTFPLAKGDILRQDYYEQGKALLILEAIEHGYLDAKFTDHQIRVYRAERRAEIFLKLNTGVRYRFGRTSFLGESGYPERFLRRYLSYREGDFFSHRKLGQSQVNLTNADLFRQVSIAPDNEQVVGDQMPVKIELQPAPRHRLRPGIGYGTDTGARLSMRYHDLNLFQKGHELKGDLLLAQKKQSLVTTYIIPDLDRLDSQTQLRLGYDREESDSYLSRELFSEAAYQRALGRKLHGALFLRLTQEYSEIADESTRSQMLLPGGRLQWRKMDNPVNPRYGLQGNIEIKGAATNLLSDTSLLQLTAQSTNLFPLPNDFSLFLRLHGGASWLSDPLSELPASLRFFAGGDRSVRGYGYQSLGPQNDAGQVVGGKHLLVANFELEKRFTSEWGGALFYDVGNAFDTFSEYELEQGAGIGIRRYTPIGPIRLDFARQLGNSKQRWRIHLSMGLGW